MRLVERVGFPSYAMTKSHMGCKHVSLFCLPVSDNLLSPKVAQIDDALQYVPLVGSSAWKEIKIRAACDQRLPQGC